MITLGIDVGSLFTKAVLLENDRILSTAIRETSGTINLEAGVFVDLVLSQGGVTQKDVATITSTGQGDELIEQADYLEDDVACIAAATRHHLADAELALEIGGQSITGVLINPQGDIVNYMRNDKCASGTGRFIEVIGAALGVKMEQFDQTVAQAAKKITVSSQCAVFAESEIISHVNQGESVNDIIAGVCESTARIIISQALRFGPVKHYTVTGGVALFSSITKILEEKLPGSYQRFPIDPRYAAAFGAALLGQQE
jgi:(R)-2-hydroxyacyl-CoA dehydratese activating ATPase